MRVPIADSGGRTIFGELAETHGFGHTKQKKVAYATAPGEDEDDEDEPEHEHEHEHEPEADDAEDDEDVEYNDEEEDPEDTEDGDEPPPERAMKGKKKPVVVRKKKRVVYATAAESGAACYPRKPKQKYKKHPMKEAAALDRAYERILREADRGEFEEVPLDPFARPGLLAEHGTPGQKNYPHAKGGGKAAAKYRTKDEDEPWRTMDYRQSDVAGSGRIERGPATPETSAKAIRQNVGKQKHAVTYHDSGQAPGGRNHLATYRDMEIHTLPSYSTPYYYVNASGFGSMQHSTSLARIKRQIDTFKDTGVTANKADRSKASARYQKRKARGY